MFSEEAVEVEVAAEGEGEFVEGSGGGEERGEGAVEEGEVVEIGVGGAHDLGYYFS